MAVATAFQSASRVRAATLPGRALSLATAFSIGLTSGLQGGRNRGPAPAAAMASRPAMPLWLARLSLITPSPGRERRDQHLPDAGEEALALDGALDQPRRLDAAEPEPGDERGVRQGPWGTPARRRSPFGARPRLRAIFRVEPGLVDDDRPRRVGIGLRVEPGLAPRGDARAVLRAGVRRPFLNDPPGRRKKRCAVEGAKRARSSRAAISTSVMAAVPAALARIVGPAASIRPERVSPPWARGASEPVSSHSRRPFTAADGATPNRCAAARHRMPASRAPITRCLRARERGFVREAGLLHQPPLPITIRLHTESPMRSRQRASCPRSLSG